MAKKVKAANKGSIIDLFHIMEMTRSQPQYGYVAGGVKRWQLSYLAEHHYLVTFIAWQLTEIIKAADGKVDALKVLELCMIHDLGELFGGDIGMPYARRNPKAKKLAREFEGENARFLAQFFLQGSNKFKKTWAEATEPKSDEGKIAKIADLLEIFFFKNYTNDLNEIDLVLAKERLPKMADSIKDSKARMAMQEVVAEYFKNSKTTARSIISGIK